MKTEAKSFPRAVERVCSLRTLVAENPVEVSHVAGDPETIIRSVAAPEHAISGSLVFAQTGPSPRISGAVVVTSEPFEPDHGCCVVTEDPRRWFVAALDVLFPPPAPVISKQARVAPSAAIAHNVAVGPYSVIEDDVSIGEGTRIGSHVTIHGRSRIGRDCVIQDHTTVGSSGVAYYPDSEGEWYGLQHLGMVEIGDRVELGAHCVVVRGILYDTVVGAGTKIGNFVNIGHNASIGRNCWITSGVVICGRVVLGERVKVAAAACIRDKVSIGDGAHIGLGTVVTKDVAAGLKLFGNPGRPLRTMGPF
jgi:UDP-3-O-[3-hydroxymyristoyl] glucosamine N-acyltransferase